MAAPSPTLPAPYDRRDANVIGEYLRDAAFPEHGVPDADGYERFGCYTTFEVREDAVEFTDEQRLALLAELYGIYDHLDGDEVRDLAKDDAGMGRGFVFTHQGMRVEMVWVWDGDGALTFRVYDPEGQLVAAVTNSDCKKNYRWEHLPMTSAGAALAQS